MKSRDTILPTKWSNTVKVVHTVKAMAFKVVAYRCESWTIKKAECHKELMLLNCGAGKDSSESPREQGDQTSQS